MFLGPRPRRSFRARLAATAQRLSGVVAELRTPAPASSRAAAAAQSVADPAGLFTADEMPGLEVIEAEAAKYARAVEQARTADRGKRAARKLLDRLPAGRYGAWQVERVESAREVADLERIRAIFAANGLGDVPMKGCAPSLKVGPAPVDVVPALAEAELRTLAAVAR